MLTTISFIISVIFGAASMVLMEVCAMTEVVLNVNYIYKSIFIFIVKDPKEFNALKLDD